MATIYSKKTEMSQEKQPYFTILIGVLLLLVTVGIAFFFIKQEQKKPDDVQFYRGEVSDIKSIDSYRDTEKKSNGDTRTVTYYDCKVMVEYEINGQEYEYLYKSDEMKDPIELGDIYYLEVSPSKPEHVYSIGTVKSKTLNNVLKYLAVGIFGIAGAIMIGSGVMGLKKKNTYTNIYE